MAHIFRWAGRAVAVAIGIAVWTAAAATAANVVLAQPVQPARGGAETLLVSVPGALVPGIEYQPVVDAIRAVANLTLWTAVLTDFAGEFPNPPEAEAGVIKAIDAARAAGFAAIQDADVWIIAHSLGGTISGELVRDRYGGLILMGSYLAGARTEDLRTFPKPVIHLAGDLDGLVQVTRTAEEYRVALELLRHNNESEAVLNKPVVIIEGLNHAQMGNGFVTEALLESDFPAELPQEVATEALAEFASTFLELHRRADAPDLVAAAYDKIREGLLASEATVRFFIDGQDADSAAAWCELGQRSVANLGDAADARTAVTAVAFSDPISFGASLATLTTAGNGTASVRVPGYLERRAVVQSEGEVGYELQCKLKAQSALVDALQLSGSEYGPRGDCRVANDNLFQLALASMSPTTAARYAAIGKPVTFAADLLADSEAAWADAQATYVESADVLTITAPALSVLALPPTDGAVYYCKGLPAARAASWIQHNSLPRGLDRRR